MWIFLLFSAYDQTPVLKLYGAIAQADSMRHLLLTFLGYAGSNFLGLMLEVFCDPHLQAYQITLVTACDFRVDHFSKWKCQIAWTWWLTYKGLEEAKQFYNFNIKKKLAVEFLCFRESTFFLQMTISCYPDTLNAPSPGTLHLRSLEGNVVSLS